MERITPCLWFDKNAEEAARFYVSIFKNSRIGTLTRYEDEGLMPKGTVMTVSFQLDGQEFMTLNGGPMFEFTPAISFVVHCDTQEEVDEYWERLGEGGERQMCGWLKDRYGVSWQIVPKMLILMLRDADEARRSRVRETVLTMEKLDIGRLKQAYEGQG